MAWLPDDFRHPHRADLPTLGCLYIDPPEKQGEAGAEVSWWVVDEIVGSDVQRAFDEFVPRWLEQEWPLPARARLVGRDLSWDDWIALPGRD